MKCRGVATIWFDIAQAMSTRVLRLRKTGGQSISHHHYKNNAPQTRCFFFVVRGEITASSRVRHEMPWSRNHLVRHRASDEHEDFAFTQNRRAIHLPPPLQKQRTSPGVAFFCGTGGDHGFQPCKAWFVSYFRLIDGDCSVRGIMPEKVAVLRILPGIC